MLNILIFLDNFLIGIKMKNSSRQYYKYKVDKEYTVLKQFLNFLATEMEANPQNIQALDSNLRERVSGLVAWVEVDFDLPLSEEDE